MPTLPKGKKRPWIPEKPKHMREVDNASFYNSKRWRALRNYFIQKNPICAQCKRDGIIKGAQCVDHIKAISKFGMGVATDINNLQSLCNSCHAKKSSREGAEKRNNTKIYKRK
tara:strand:+ start:217 stop:555 length:339 start_codon:yes stop_codon:yes gene_type:complete